MPFLEPTTQNTIATGLTMMTPALVSNDTSYDNGAAINATIAALDARGGGILALPTGKFWCQTTPFLNETSSVSIWGSGSGFAYNDVNAPTERAATTLAWNGAADATGVMLKMQKVMGCRVQHLMLDGNGLATFGFYLTGLYGGGLHDVTFVRGQRNGDTTSGYAGTVDSVGLYLEGTPIGGTPNTLALYNTFDQVLIDAATGLWLTGDTAFTQSDCTLNHFNLFHCTYGSTTGNAVGIYYDHCDANISGLVHTFRLKGTGASVHYGTHARKNSTQYLDPPNGVTVDTPSTAGWQNTVLSYDRGDSPGGFDNSPTLATGARFWWNDATATPATGRPRGLETGGRILNRAPVLGYTQGAGTGTINVDSSLGEWFTVSIPNGRGADVITVKAPSNAPDTIHTGHFFIEIKNASGGAFTGSITFEAVAGGYDMAGLTFTPPANGKRRWARFDWTTTSGLLWVCTGVAAADY